MEKSLYGIYPGKLKEETKYIESCSEFELYSQLCTYYEPFRMNAYYNKVIAFYEAQNDTNMINYFKRIRDSRKIRDKDLEEYKYAMDYCLLASARFDTKVTYNPNGRVIITDEFKNWYENWSIYAATMDKETLLAYRHYRYQAKSLEKFKVNQKLDMATISEIDKDSIARYEYKPIKLLQKNIKQKLA